MASSLDGVAQTGPTDVPPPEEVRAQLARIVGSGEFRAARSRARFLEYVVVRALEGGYDSLKEYTIGVEVFDRGASFDPRADGVVRTQAALVRKHLERYYANEGLRDPVEIGLPKGHYVPRFQRRAAERVPPAEHARGPRRRWVLGAVSATLLAALVASGFLRSTGREHRVTGDALAEDFYRPVWGPFLGAGASNVLAFGIPQFFTGGPGLWIRDVEVNSPSLSPGTGRLEAINRQVGPLQPAEAYTGIGEAYGVHMLTRFFLGNGRELRVVRSPSVSWDTLKHDNVIFLTSARFKTLADRLSYPAEFVHVMGAPNRVGVRNLHPAPGEQADYMAQTSDLVSVDYAIISVWPGKLPGHRILVLSGGYTWGTQAAAEYVTEPAYLRDLRDRMLACQRRSGQSRHPEFFQVLLRVEGRDSQPTSATFVTHRDLALDETGSPLTDQSASAQPAR